MKIQVDQEEWWPVYEINMRGFEIDIPDDKAEWLNKLFEDFEKGQDYLREEYKKASDKYWEEREEEEEKNKEKNEADFKAKVAAYKAKREKEKNNEM